MKKSKPSKQTTTIEDEDAIDASGPLDWTPLFGAFREAFEWALDVAAHIARDYPEEVESVERVRRFMRKRIAGEPSHIRVDDVLLTFALIMGAIERDLGPVSNLGPWFATPMRFPSETELWERVLPRHVGVSIRFTPSAFTAPFTTT